MSTWANELIREHYGHSSARHYSPMLQISSGTRYGRSEGYLMFLKSDNSRISGTERLITL